MNITYITELPQVTSRAKELQWSIDYWQHEYASASIHQATAWRMYNEAIDNELPRDEINELFGLATLFDDITMDTWREWQNAKRDYLALVN